MGEPSESNSGKDFTAEELGCSVPLEGDIVPLADVEAKETSDILHSSRKNHMPQGSEQRSCQEHPDQSLGGTHNTLNHRLGSKHLYV